MRLTGNDGLFGRCRSSVGTLVAFLIRVRGDLIRMLRRRSFRMAVLEMIGWFGKWSWGLRWEKQRNQLQNMEILILISQLLMLLMLLSQEQHQGSLLCPSLCLCFCILHFDLPFALHKLSVGPNVIDHNSPTLLSVSRSDKAHSDFQWVCWRIPCAGWWSVTIREDYLG